MVADVVHPNKMATLSEIDGTSLTIAEKMNESLCPFKLQANALITCYTSNTHFVMK
jgi:hypothetical protein